MAVIAFYVFQSLHKKSGAFAARIFAGILAELFMILGYYIFEGFLYGFAPSIVNIPPNGVQGIAGIILSLILIKILEKVIAK